MMCVKRFNELARSVHELQTDVESLQSQQFPRAPRVPAARRPSPNLARMSVNERLQLLRLPTAPPVPRRRPNTRTVDARLTALVGGPRQRRALKQSMLLEMQGEASRLRKRRRTVRNTNTNTNNGNNGNNGNFRASA